MNRTRKRLICTQCERPVRTFKAGTLKCLPCAAQGHWPPFESKHDLEIALRVKERMSA